MSGKAIFIKYWLIGEPLLTTLLNMYHISNLPGRLEGVSGSNVMGNNIGVIRNITDYKREASVEVFKYFTSKIYQRRVIEKRSCTTALTELLYDEEICKIAICDIFRGIQFTIEPSFIKEGPEGYREMYKKYIYQYLYEGKSTDYVLKRLNDVTKVYRIEIGTEDSYVGLICFIYFSVMTAIMLLSLFFVFRENFQPFFTFLTEDFWIVTVVGSVIILWASFVDYGPVETWKCHLKPLLLSIGFTVNITPSVHRLLTQFPEGNKLMFWICRHRYYFLLLSVVLDALVWSISLTNPYTSQMVVVEDGESFEMCKYNGIYSTAILIIYKLLGVIVILFLIFVEWSLSTTMYDLKFVILVIYIDVLSLILLYVFSMVRVKRYTLNFLLHMIAVSLIALGNYIFLYGFRVGLGLLRKQNIKLQFINNINEKFLEESQLGTKTGDNNFESNINSTVYKSNTYDGSSSGDNDNDNKDNDNTNQSVANNKTSFISRMIDYHYTKDAYTSYTPSIYSSSQRNSQKNTTNI